MLFKDIITAECIIPDLMSRTPNEALAEMVDALISAGELPADLRQGVLKGLIEREAITSTGVGKGIAIPHAKHPAIKKIVGFFARSKEGVDFGAIDGKPVHLFFMLLSNQDIIQQHLQALAYSAKHLNDEIFRRFLLSAKDEREIYKLLEEADSKTD